MNQGDALRCITMFATCWPSADMPDETAVLWSNDLKPHEAVDAIRSAEVLHKRHVWMPSMKEWLDEIKVQRGERLGQRTMLPPPSEEHCSFAEFLNGNPDWAERVKALEKPRRPKEERHVIEATLVRLISKGA